MHDDAKVGFIDRADNKLTTSGITIPERQREVSQLRAQKKVVCKRELTWKMMNYSWMLLLVMVCLLLGELEATQNLRVDKKESLKVSCKFVYLFIVLLK